MIIHKRQQAFSCCHTLNVFILSLSLFRFALIPLKTDRFHNLKNNLNYNLKRPFYWRIPAVLYALR